MTDLSISPSMSEKIAIKVSIVGIIINVLLSLFKLVAGIVGNSLAMISDCVHSMSDVFSTVVVIIGIKISSKVADEKHKFGHERFECVAAIVLAVILCLTGVEIGRIGFVNIISGDYKSFDRPTMIALVGSIVSIITKEAMFWYTYVTAKKLSSSALKADAWHHRSDAMSSIGSLLGIWGAMVGVLILDSIASIVICLLIIKVSVEIFVDSIKKMIDESADENIENDIKRYIFNNYPDCNIDDLKTRVFANKIYIDLEVGVDKNLSLDEAHQIAHQIHDNIEESFSYVKHIMIHVNPKSQ